MGRQPPSSTLVTFSIFLQTKYVLGVLRRRAGWSLRFLPVPSLSGWRGGVSFSFKPTVYISLKSTHFFASKPQKCGPESSRDDSLMLLTRILHSPLPHRAVRMMLPNLRWDHFPSLLETLWWFPRHSQDQASPFEMPPSLYQNLATIPPFRLFLLPALFLPDLRTTTFHLPAALSQVQLIPRILYFPA